MSDDQLTRGDLAGMTYQEIDAARASGRLALVTGTTPPVVDLITKATGTTAINRADIAELAALGRHDLINIARTQGRITYTKDN